MGIFSKAKKLVKKTVKKALSGVTDNSPDKVRPAAAMGPAGDTGSRATSMQRRRSRRARGRDSTIITARSEIGSRTLLG